MLKQISKVKFEPMNEIHMNEVQLLNELLEVIEADGDINNVFNKFLDDVKYHFSFEENLMEKYNFFAKVPHKMEHDKIINELQNIKDNYNDTKELLFYFDNVFIPWLDNHIKTMDTVTGGYFDMINAK